MIAPAQLQLNQSGAWRSSMVFDFKDVPQEFLQAADYLVRLAGVYPAMRIVACEQQENGTYTASKKVLMRWSRSSGWEVVS